MKVERSSLDQVKKRFELNKKKMEEKKKEYDIDQRLQELKEEVRLFFMFLAPVRRDSVLHKVSVL